MKMIVYTLVGSLLMLVGGDRDRDPARRTAASSASRSPTCASTCSPPGSQEWIFCLFAAAFLVKMPAFPIHGWMPDAYRAAPLPVLALLSGVLSKVGAYGFLRVVLPIFPEATVDFQELILIIALASILYGSVMAFTQTNVRLVAGYSSIAQLGFITLGIFALRADGADGAVLQMVNHGLVVGGDVHRHRDSLRAHEDRRPDEDGRHGDACAGARRTLPGRHDGDPGDSRVGQLHRRVLHPQRRLPVEDRLRLRRHPSASRWRPSTRCASTSARCTTGCPRASSRERSGWREGVVLAPLVACIVALALYPGLILERGEASVDAVQAVVDASRVPQQRAVGAR